MFILKIQQHVSRYGLLQLFSHCWIPDILSFYTVLKHRVCIRHIVLHSLINTTVAKFCAANYRQHKILKHSIKQQGLGISFMFWERQYYRYTPNIIKKKAIYSFCIVQCAYTAGSPQLNGSKCALSWVNQSKPVITLCIKWHSCSKWG